MIDDNEEASKDKLPDLQKEVVYFKTLIKELNSENLKLQKKIAKIEAQYISLKNENRVLKGMIESSTKDAGRNPKSSLTEEQLDAEIEKLQNKLKHIPS